MLTRMAKESGIETPTTEALIRLDRARKGKGLLSGSGVMDPGPGSVPGGGL
jgi:hypothetical protein